MGAVFEARAWESQDPPPRDTRSQQERDLDWLNHCREMVEFSRRKLALVQTKDPWTFFDPKDLPEGWTKAEFADWTLRTFLEPEDKARLVSTGTKSRGAGKYSTSSRFTAPSTTSN